jgi:outer membrane protein OmpA-like peptidoglycan-associated protein
VKSWLLITVGVNPAKVEAIGYGSTNFVVSPSGTIDQQEKNRRVEVGIKFPH